MLTVYLCEHGVLLTDCLLFIKLNANKQSIMYAAPRTRFFKKKKNQRGGGLILQIRTSFNRGGTQNSDIFGHKGGRGSKNHQKIRTSFMDGP